MAHINVPKGKSLLGVHPILAVTLQTDNTELLKKRLASLTKESITQVVQDIEDCIRNSLYPTDSTVWMFNSPEVEIEMLKAALISKNEDAIKELDGVFENFKDVYPYIDTPHTTLNPGDIVDYQSVNLDHAESNPCEDYNTTTTQQNNIGSVFTPMLTFGSLLLISKFAKSEEGLKW